LAAVAGVCGVSGSADAIISDSGYDINTLVGANTFYSNGFTGSGAIVAEVDAGLAWDGQQSLTNVTVHIPNPTGANQFGRHATWVASMIAGSGVNAYQQGIAYGATLWTGGVATQWVGGLGGYADSFNDTPASFTTPYIHAMVDGIGGKTANVVTSSFGVGLPIFFAEVVGPLPTPAMGEPPYPAPPLGWQSWLIPPWYLQPQTPPNSDQIMPSAGYYAFIPPDNPYSSGNYYESIAMDALTAGNSINGVPLSGPAKLFTCSAGNSGYVALYTQKGVLIAVPVENSTSAPASGNNAFVVGAMTPGLVGAVTNFSSIGPTSFFLPTADDGSAGSYGANVTYGSGMNAITVFQYYSRARVDIVAPGAALELAYYGGATGGNIFGGPVSLANNVYEPGLAGTSFATPAVAGGAALLVDAGEVRFPGDPNAIDGRVLKAVMMDGATPLTVGSPDMAGEFNGVDYTGSSGIGWNNGESQVQKESYNGFTGPFTTYPGGYVPLEGATNDPYGYIVTTGQALDYSQGAGEMNLTNAYNEYLNGTHDVAEPTPVTTTNVNSGSSTPITFGSSTLYSINNLGGTTAAKPVNVQANGWTFGTISVNTSGSVGSLLGGGTATNRTIHESYLINTPLLLDSDFSATLDWYATAGLNTKTFTATYGTLDNLDLSLYQYYSPTNMILLAQSVALYNTVQELRVELTYNLETLAASAYYLLDVSETLPIYSFDGAITTDYGLAWNDDEAGIVTLPTGANGFPTDSSYVNESQYLPNFPAPTFVPEPGALSLLGLGVMSLILRRKKRWTG